MTLKALVPAPLKEALKSLWRRYRGQRREAELRRDEPHTTREQLTADLVRLGIRQGDVVFVHSSLKSLGYVEGGPRAVIDAMQAAVGPEGTLLLPTYYMPGGTILATCEMADYVFDPRRHGTHMGALPAAFLATPGVERSIHPTHSVAALGRQAQFLTEAHHLAPSVFGTGSPWQRFHELNGKVLGLGVSMGPITFYHLLEDTLGDAFPLRVWLERSYQMPCLDWQGARHLVPVRPYDPELVRLRIDQPTRTDLREFFQAEFTREGLMSRSTVGRTEAWTIEAHAFLAHLRRMAERGVTIYTPPAQIAALAPR